MAAGRARNGTSHSPPCPLNALGNRILPALAQEDAQKIYNRVHRGQAWGTRGCGSVRTCGPHPLGHLQMPPVPASCYGRAGLGVCCRAGGFGRPAWEAHRTPASGGAGGPALCKPPHTPLSDPQTCPGPGPPLSAVIRVMAHTCPTDGDRISKHLCFQTPKGQRKERQPRAAPAWSRGPGSAVGVLLAHKVPSQLLAVSRPEASMVRPVAPFLGSSPDPTSFYLFIYFCSIRALTQGLPLEPLPQPFL
jgi:hypothetical protein